jgi:hypothetical protein
VAREDATTIPADVRESRRAVEHISTLLGYTGGVAEQFEKTALEKGSWRLTDTGPRAYPEPITTKKRRLAALASHVVYCMRFRTRDLSEGGFLAGRTNLLYHPALRGPLSSRRSHAEPEAS